MLRQILLPLVLILASTLAVPARAEIDPESDPCASVAARIERERGIPGGLLRAISLTESGRVAPGTKRTVAWPWTIWADGRGQYFPTKAEAIAAVKALQAKGIRSIDVGCMQVNLHYHRQAFPNLETAFDPQANIRYAADFLGSLKEREGSWAQAVGYYHSATPDLNKAYRERVLARWRGVDAAGANVAATRVAAKPATVAGKPIPPTASSLFVQLTNGSVKRDEVAQVAELDAPPAPTRAGTGRGLADYRSTAIPVARRR